MDKPLLKPESAWSGRSPGGRGQHQELETGRTQALVSASGWVSSCLVCGGLVRAGGRARSSPGGQGRLPCVCPLTQSRAPWRPSREITEHRGDVGSSRSQLWTQSHTSSQGPKPPGSQPTFLGSGGRGRARQDAPGKCPGQPGSGMYLVSVHGAGSHGTKSPWETWPCRPRRKRAWTACTWPSPTPCPPEVCFRSVSADSSLSALWDGHESPRAVAPGTRPAPCTVKQRAVSGKPRATPPRRRGASATARPRGEVGFDTKECVHPPLHVGVEERGGFTENLNRVIIS